MIWLCNWFWAFISHFDCWNSRKIPQIEAQKCISFAWWRPILNKLPKILAPVFTCPTLLEVLVRACGESRVVSQRTHLFLFCFVFIPFISFFLVLNYSGGFVEFIFVQSEYVYYMIVQVKSHNSSKFASIFLKIRRVF